MVGVLAFISGGGSLLAGLAVAAVVILVLARTGVQTADALARFLLIASLIVGVTSAAFVSVRSAFLSRVIATLREARGRCLPRA